MEELLWVSLCILTAIAGFLYGKQIESFKALDGKRGSFGEQDLDNPKDLTLFKDEPKDYNHIKEELKRERESKKKQIDEYEKEINYLKSLIDHNQAHYNAKIV